MHSAGYDVSERQLDRWVAQIKADKPAISTIKATGAKTQLTREDRNIAGGWVLTQNLNGASAHLDDYNALLQRAFQQVAE